MRDQTTNTFSENEREKRSLGRKRSGRKWRHTVDERKRSNGGEKVSGPPSEAPILKTRGKIEPKTKQSRSKEIKGPAPSYRDQDFDKNKLTKNWKKETRNCGGAKSCNTERPNYSVKERGKV